MATTAQKHLVLTGEVKTGITALAGGATPSLAANTLDAFNVIATCATAGDSVILPAGMPQGSIVTVLNSGAAAADVFPPTGGTINGGTPTTGDFRVTNAKVGVFVCTSANDGLTWVGVLSA
jgi:hypothetical protein